MNYDCKYHISIASATISKVNYEKKGTLKKVNQCIKCKKYYLTNKA